LTHNEKKRELVSLNVLMSDNKNGVKREMRESMHDDIWSSGAALTSSHVQPASEEGLLMLMNACWK
jgi:hypothetical protein